MAANRSNGSIIGKVNKTSAGGNTIRQFNASGQYKVPDTVNEIDVLVVGGGGGGGETSEGGGGGAGAGGFRNVTQQVSQTQRNAVIGVVVGGGGAINNGANGSNGDASQLGYNPVGGNPQGNIEASHGGYGGANTNKGANGASGGGGGYGSATGDQGDGNTPVQDPVQGYPAGRYVDGHNGGAGGGGAGGAGSNPASTTVGGAGGPGAPSSVTGVSRYYSGGGGGASNSAGGAGGLGGGGGGGNPAITDAGAHAGQANFGGGGGGAYNHPGGQTAGTGGSGVVIVKEKNKAEGLWNMNAQNSAQIKGQWPKNADDDAGISNSLRVNDDDNPYLIRTPTSIGNRKTWTWSAWFKIGNLVTSGSTGLFSSYWGNDDNGYMQFGFDSSDRIGVWGYSTTWRISNASFRDPSAWYHIVLAVDSTQSNAAFRVKVYVNGSEITSWSTNNAMTQNLDTAVNYTGAHYLSSLSTTQAHHDGYFSDVHLIDGQALPPTYFGQSDPESPNIWRPIRYYGQHGVNGSHLEFKQNGVGTGSASTVGADTSGNGNHWTSSGIAATDQVLDIPTNNFCTMNHLSSSTDWAFTEGNLKLSYNGANDSGSFGTMGVSSGKWYWEIVGLGANSSGYQKWTPGVISEVNHHEYNNRDGGYAPYATALYGGNGNVYQNNSSVSSSYDTFAQNDIVQIALDVDNNNIYFGKNNTWMNSGSPTSGATGTGAINITAASAYAPYLPSIGEGLGSPEISFIVNFGQDSSFAGNKTAQGNSDGNGRGDFYYAPPTDFLSLCSQNMASHTTIDDPESNFNTVAYEGNVKARTIQGVGFQPDFNWIRNYDVTTNNLVFDSMRGNGSYSLRSDGENIAATATDEQTGYAADGIVLANGEDVNGAGESIVSWNWRIPDSYSVSESGSGSTGYAAISGKRNIAAGMSIMTWTGNGGSHYRFSHGLSGYGENKQFAAIIKRLDTTSEWAVYHASDPTDYVVLNTNAGQTDNGTYWNDFQANATYFQIPSGNANLNASSATYVGYCFHSVDGFSRVGTWIGNNNANGSFIYTGFRPAWVLMKRFDASDSWAVADNRRSPDNPVDDRIAIDSTGAHGTDVDMCDFLANGFKLRTNDSQFNADGGTYIYIAFAECPLVTSSGTPANAR